MVSIRAAQFIVLLVLLEYHAARGLKYSTMPNMGKVLSLSNRMYQSSKKCQDGECLVGEEEEECEGCGSRVVGGGVEAVGGGRGGGNVAVSLTGREQAEGVQAVNIRGDSCDQCGILRQLYSDLRSGRRRIIKTIVRTVTTYYQ